MYAICYKELVKKDEGINNNMAKKRDKKISCEGNGCEELSNGQKVDSRIYSYLQEMFDAARKDGIYPVVWEGYRTYEEQQKILDDKIKAYINEGYSQSRAERTAKEWVALPGTSEHQLGIAVDINADKSKSSNDEVYTWLAANAHNYGFCIDKEGVTEEWLNSKAKSARMYGKLCKFDDEEKAIQIAQQKLERCKREGKTKPFCVQHF